MSTGLDARHLRQALRDRNAKKNTVYDSVVEKCCRILRRAVEENGCEEYEYAVPHFVVGAPLYDVADCVDYVRTKLRSMGFGVEMTDEADARLRITWAQPKASVLAPKASVRAPSASVRAPSASDRVVEDPVSRWMRAHPGAGGEDAPRAPPAHSFPPPNQFLSSKLLDASRPRLPFLRHDP